MPVATKTRATRTATRTSTRTAARTPAAKPAPKAEKPVVDHRHAWKVKSKAIIGQNADGSVTRYRRDATCTICGLHEKDQYWSQATPADERPQPKRNARRAKAA